MLIFDEELLIEKLTGLSRRSRAAFALLAAFRILPCYRRFALRTGLGAPDELEELSEIVWRNLLARVEAKELQAASLVAEELVQSEDEAWEAETQPFAEDAAAAVAYAAGSLASGSAQDAAWAGRRVYEAIDFFVRKSSSSTVSQLESEPAILSHPLIQQELERQEQDLRDLAEWEIAGCSTDVLEMLRERSENASVTFFQDEEGRSSSAGAGTPKITDG